MREMRVDGITVGHRYRQDLGDIDSLARSIERVTLLHPLVVTDEGELVAGRRRLEAVRKLGWFKVPVTVVNLDEVGLKAAAVMAMREKNPAVKK